MHPAARSKDLLVEPMLDETIVYDLEAHRSHCLNRTAKAVWGYCDGKTPVESMPDRLHDDLGLPGDPALICDALRQLSEAGLLQQPFDMTPAPPASSRRQLCRRLAVAAAALPLITSIVAPTPAMAQSRARRRRRH